jgi:hypothetical protein
MLASRAISSLRSTPLAGRAVSLPTLAGVAAHVLVAAWLFAPALWAGRMLYLRDISAFTYPNLVFLERSLAAGVFPLWNPGTEAGAPFLLLYPIDVLLVATGGARTALDLGPMLHTLIASLGASALARHLGLRPLAAWTCGLVFVLSGFMVSSVSVMQLHQGAAWAPLVILAALRCARDPRPPAMALFGVMLALQVSTMAGEIVVQTAAAALILLWGALHRRGVAALAVGTALAALVAAPAILGAASYIEGTRRGAGFSAAEAVSGSLAPVELAGVLLPQFFGDMHTLTDVGFWGQDVFMGGFPYLLSLYLGIAVLGLAAAAGRDRIWIVVAAGVLLALGAHGPFGAILGRLAVFRTPVKFLFLASLGLSLLAGRGIDRAAQRRAHPATLLPAIAIAALALCSFAAPDATARALSVFPPLAAPGAQAVIRSVWPHALLASGLIALGAAASAARGGTLVGLAAGLAVLDLLIVNGDVNRFAPAAFYVLRPEVRGLLGATATGAPFRVFGYGVGNTPGLRFAPPLLRENADVWLYYLDRQVLWGRAPVLDGLEGALDEDRTASAPPGSTLDVPESVPAAFASVHARMRLANIRWILSFAPLPGELVAERGRAVLPEVLAPLRLYELRDPLPRAFWVPAHRTVASREEARTVMAEGAFDPRAEVLLERGLAAADGPRVDGAPAPTVVLESAGPHAVRLRAQTPPGYVVWLSGWHSGWEARDAGGAPVAVLPADDRYIALATAGGDQTFDLVYRPRWWARSLVLSALGLAGAVAMIAAGRPRKRARSAVGA